MQPKSQCLEHFNFVFAPESAYHFITAKPFCTSAASFSTKLPMNPNYMDDINVPIIWFTHHIDSAIRKLYFISIFSTYVSGWQSLKSIDSVQPVQKTIFSTHTCCCFWWAGRNAFSCCITKYAKQSEVNIKTLKRSCKVFPINLMSLKNVLQILRLENNLLQSETLKIVLAFKPALTSS